MLKRLLVASLGIFFATALEKDANGKPFDCGTDTAHASTEFLSSIQSLHGDKNQGSPAARAALVSRGTNKDNNSAISIEAVFHIVTTNANKNAIKQDMPKKQLDSLNDSYKPYGIQFTLKNTTWITNDKWAVGATADDTAMKKALRQGTYRTLNIYFQTDLAGGVLGRCTLPSNVANGKSDPSVYFSDGCNVNANTMPSGAMDGYNFGKTAVHETGHWLGLLHTFEGYSCDGPGDYIDDTPMESESTDGCPMDPPKQTCPNQPGNDKDDPIHNYMDYSIDECYEGFTPKQHDRMHYLYNMYRDGN